LCPVFDAVDRYDPQVPNRICGRLAAAGFVAGPVESLAEVWSRSMGITCVELRALLGQRAAGTPAE
jgi:hypothetical protein